MDCADVRAALSSGGKPEGPDAAAHLSSCPACAMLVQSPGLVRALDVERRAPPSGVDALLARTLASVDGEQGRAARMRAWPTTRRLGLALAVMVATPLVVLAVTPRPDLDIVPPGRFAVDVMLYALPAIVALAVALWPMQRTVSARTRGLVAVACVLAAACVAALPPLHRHPGVAIPEGAFGRLAVMCFAFGTLAAVPAFAILRVLAREGTSVGTKATALGLAAALSGSAAVFLHCPITAPAHLWAGHFVVLVPALVWALVHARGRV